MLLVTLNDQWALRYYRGRYWRTANGGKGIAFPTMASAKDFADSMSATILSATGRSVKFTCAAVSSWGFTHTECF